MMMDTIIFKMQPVFDEQQMNLPKAGHALYDKMIEACESGRRLIVDMTNVTSLPSIFLNVSIGRFVDEQGKEALKRTLSFMHITKAQALRLQDYLQRY